MSEEPRLCGAKTRNGTPCRQAPERGHSRCHRHGARAGRRITHGRRSRLAETFGSLWDAVSTDPELRDFNADLELLLAREAELLSRLPEGDSPKFREDALALVAPLARAVDRSDWDAVPKLLLPLRQHLEQGGARDAVWESLVENVRERGLLMTQATTCETRAANALTGRAVVALLEAMVDIIRSEVGEDAARRIGLRFQNMLGPCMETTPGNTALVRQ